MAPSHVPQGQLPAKQLHKPNAFDALMKPSRATQLRPGPHPKAIELRSVCGARVPKARQNLLRSSPKPHPSTNLPHIDEETLIGEFEAQRAAAAAYIDPLPERESEDSSQEEERRRVSYTRENKLSAISYALTAKVQTHNGELKPISKYSAAKKLKITIPMLKNWIANQVNIENMRKGTRKNRAYAAKFPELEARLVELFKMARDHGNSISKRWFIQQAKEVFEALFSNQVRKKMGQLTVYVGFEFSNGWFQAFRKRNGISLRRSIKRSQKVRSLFYY